MNPLMSRAEDLFSSSRVRALPSREKAISQRPAVIGNTTSDTNTLSHTDSLLDRVVHGLADVHHGIEDDRVSGWLHLVSAGDRKTSHMKIFPQFTKGSLPYAFIFFLLYEDLHDGPADLHPYAVLLEHIQKRQETLLQSRERTWNPQHGRQLDVSRKFLLTMEKSTEKLWK